MNMVLLWCLQAFATSNTKGSSTSQINIVRRELHEAGHAAVASGRGELRLRSKTGSFALY